MSFVLPNQFIKESAKDKEWYMAHAQAVQRHVAGKFNADGLTRDEENFNDYNGIVEPKKIKGKIAPLGLTSPTPYRRYGLTRAMVSTLYSEFQSMKLDQKCSSVDQESIIRKDKFKLDIITNKLLADYNKQISEQLGFDVKTKNPDLPTPDDIDKYMKMNHREVVEDIIDGTIEYVLVVKEKREQIDYAFLNFLITDKAFFKIEEEDGDPSFRQIDPRRFFSDLPFGTDYIDEAELAGDIQYMNKTQVIHKFFNCDCPKDRRLTKEEAKEIINSNHTSASNTDLSSSSTRFQPIRLNEYGEPEFSVISFQWRGKKIYSYKESPSKKNPELIYRKNTREGYKPKKGERTRSFLFDEVYKCTLVGGKYLVDWGVVENQDRSVDAIHKANIDYVGLYRGITNNTSMSLVEKLKYFDEMDSDLYYAIRQALNRAGGKSIVYDMALLPTEMFGTPENAMKKVAYHLKENNVIWINTRKGGVNKSSFNQFKDVDFGISNTVSSLINLKAMNMQAAEFATGISPQRQANIGQYETSGNADRSIEQSFTRTKEYFAPFNKLIARVFTKVANKAKYIWPAGKKIAFIAGDATAKVLDIIPELPLSDYGFYIGDTVKDKMLKRQFEQVSTVMLQNTQDPRLMLEVFKIMKADSAAEAEAIFEQGVEALEKIQQQREERDQAMQQQIAEINKQTEEIKERNADKDRENKIKIADIKAMNALDIATIQSEDKRDIEEAKTQKEFYLKDFEYRQSKEQEEKQAQQTQQNANQESEQVSEN